MRRRNALGQSSGAELAALQSESVDFVLERSRIATVSPNDIHRVGLSLRKFASQENRILCILGQLFIFSPAWLAFSSLFSRVPDSRAKSVEAALHALKSQRSRFPPKMYLKNPEANCQMIFVEPPFAMQNARGVKQ